MIHFLKKCLTVKPYYPKLEPHLSALRGEKKKKTRDSETNACEIKTPCLVISFKII